MSKYIKHMTNGKRVFALHQTKGWKLVGLLKTFSYEDRRELTKEIGKAVKL